MGTLPQTVWKTGLHLALPCRAALIAAMLLGGLLSTKTLALDVYLNYGSGYIDIQDTNSSPDLDPATGSIKFNLSLPGYNVQGHVDSNVGNTLTSITGGGTAGLRLTSFTAEAVGVPSYPLHVGFKDILSSTFTNITGADVIDAYVSHNPTNVAVPVATDTLLFWQGYVDLLTMGTPFGGPVPGGNPFFPASSVPVQYPLYGHGPIFYPGTFTNPLIGADLYINLGASGDQFILNSSAEVGIAAVPEPGTFALFALGGLGLLASRRGAGLARRLRVRRAPRRAVCQR